MSTVPTQIRIDANVKKQANELFSELGMDMSGAVNIFLRQCVLMDAMSEARRISRDPEVPGYANMDDLRKALEE